MEDLSTSSPVTPMEKGNDSTFALAAILVLGLLLAPAASAAPTPSPDEVSECTVWTLEWRNPAEHPQWAIRKVTGPALCTADRASGDVVHVDPPSHDPTPETVSCTVDVRPHGDIARLDDDLYDDLYDDVEDCLKQMAVEDVPVRPCVDRTYEDGVRAAVCHHIGLGGAVYVKAGPDGVQAGYKQGIRHCYVYAGPDGASVGPEGDLRPCAV